MKTAVHQYEDKLLEFAYGELPAHEAGAVEAHVRGCARCTHALDEIRSVRNAMAQLPAEPAPDAGLESLLAFAEVAAKRNAEAGKPVPFWKKYLTPLVLVATMVTVGVVATQANKEVDLSPAAAASDKTASDYSRREERKKEAAPAPDPVAAVAPSPEPEVAQDIVAEQKALDSKGNAGGGERDDSLSGLLGTQGKRGNLGGLGTASRGGGTPVTKSAPVEKKPMPKVLAEERDSLAKSPPPPPAQAPGAGPSQDKDTASGYGLSGGGRLVNDYDNSGRAVRLKEAEGAATPSTEAVAPPSPAPAATTVPLEAAKREAKNDAPAAKQKKSMSVSGGSLGSAGLSAAEDESVTNLDRVGTDGDAKLADRQRAATATTSLENARAASQKGDRKGEVAYATEAINRGATGSARLEALTHLCNGYEALGQYAAADSWCDALLREFPNTSAAQNLAQRRANTQQYRAAPAKASTSSPAAADQAQ